MAKMSQSVIRLANATPHPWTGAMYGLLIQTHTYDTKLALYWFREMIEKCPNPGGFTVLLSSIAQRDKETRRDGDAELLSQIHTKLLDMKETVTPDARLIDVLLQCYGKLGNPSKVLEILRSYHGSKEAILDSGNYQTALQYCDRSYDTMYEIVNMVMDPSVEISIDAERWTSLLDTLAYLRTSEAAERAQELVEQRTPDNIMAWTTVIKAWGLADVPLSGQKIWTIYESLHARRHEVTLDAAFYTALLFYLCRTHDERAFHRACSVLEVMEQRDPHVPIPTADHYDPILEAFLARSRIKTAKDQINYRMELFFKGKNPDARPQHSSFRQFTGAFIRKKKDLRPLTKLLFNWSAIYQKHHQNAQGPDLVAYEMLYVGWQRGKTIPEREIFLRKVEEIIRHKVRLGTEVVP